MKWPAMNAAVVANGTEPCLSLELGCSAECAGDIDHRSQFSLAVPLLQARARRAYVRKHGGSICASTKRWRGIHHDG